MSCAKYQSSTKKITLSDYYYTCIFPVRTRYTVGEALLIPLGIPTGTGKGIRRFLSHHRSYGKPFFKANHQRTMVTISIEEFRP